MSTVPCPFCGEMMTPSIRFCTGCGRSINKEDLNRVSLKLGKAGRGEEDGQSYDLSRKDHVGTRKMRTFLYTTAAIVAVVTGYYFVMRYVLHEHIPGNLDIVLEQLISGQPVTPQDVPASQLQSAQPQSSPSDPAQPAPAARQ